MAIMLVEEFTRVLSEKARRVIREREGGYILLVAEILGKRLLFCLKESHAEYYYVKIIPEDDLSSLSCKEAEYSPLGLYAFSKSPVELAKKSYEKAIALVTRSERTIVY
ncbi:MAG: hypothetical protein QXP03_02230 [Desulfurococcaceae archaeon]